MDEKFTKLKGAFDPAVGMILSCVPDCYSKDQAISKLQECIWWCEKGINDELQRIMTDDQPKKD